MSLVYNYRFGDETSQGPKDIYHPEDTQEPARAASENSRWWGGDIKKAENYYNVIHKAIFQIPINQVNI